jgi:hypothetical protein
MSDLLIKLAKDTSESKGTPSTNFGWEVDSAPSVVLVKLKPLCLDPRMPELAECTTENPGSTEVLVAGVTVDFEPSTSLKIKPTGFSPTGPDAVTGFDPAEVAKPDANGDIMEVALGVELIFENTETGCAVCRLKSEVTAGGNGAC